MRRGRTCWRWRGSMSGRRAVSGGSGADGEFAGERVFVDAGGEGEGARRGTGPGLTAILQEKPPHNSGEDVNSSCGCHLARDCGAGMRFDVPGVLMEISFVGVEDDFSG